LIFYRKTNIFSNFWA